MTGKCLLHVNDDCKFRRLEAHKDWEQLLQLSVVTRDRGFPEPLYRVFGATQQPAMRRLVDNGVGDSCGAFSLTSTLWPECLNATTSRSAEALWSVS